MTAALERMLSDDHAEVCLAEDNSEMSGKYGKKSVHL